jgi:hypothetical protein
LTFEVKACIADVVEKKRWLTCEEWEGTVRTQAALRLFRNSEVIKNYNKLRALKQPKLILSYLTHRGMSFNRG